MRDKQPPISETQTGALIVLVLAASAAASWAPLRIDQQYLANTPARRAPMTNAPLGVLDLNQASRVELQRLPGVGPAIANRIATRRARAVFRSVDQLTHVRGIGPVTLSRIRPYLTVDGSEKVEPITRSKSSGEDERIQVAR